MTSPSVRTVRFKAFSLYLLHTFMKVCICLHHLNKSYLKVYMVTYRFWIYQLQKHIGISDLFFIKKYINRKLTSEYFNSVFAFPYELGTF